jgi:hypothetical protein
MTDMKEQWMTLVGTEQMREDAEAAEADDRHPLAPPPRIYTRAEADAVLDALIAALEAQLATARAVEKPFDCECGQVGPCGPKCIAHSRATPAPAKEV